MNQDEISPLTGFAPHPHKDMEIITYVIEGEILHEDSQGNQGLIKAGEMQRMSAGSGIVHSEKNPSKDECSHSLNLLSLFQLKP